MMEKSIKINMLENAPAMNFDTWKAEIAKKLKKFHLKKETEANLLTSVRGLYYSRTKYASVTSAYEVLMNRVNISDVPSERQARVIKEVVKIRKSNGVKPGFAVATTR